MFWLMDSERLEKDKRLESKIKDGERAFDD